MSPTPKEKPDGELAIRVIAMPANTNPNGDVFGGWVVSQMDLAAMVFAKKHTKNRVATIAIDAMTFIAPVHVGDALCCYGEVIKTGRSSVTIRIETWAIGPNDEVRRQVTEGIFTYVSIDEQGKSTPL
ncbi:MAG: acyl-CoA thioesterase [Coxiellaceae bacterium]|nr:acyl-CoA thioesterase [Coxiellaceae bacterium]